MATNHSHPALVVGDRVADCNANGIIPSSETSAVSPRPDISSVDSCVIKAVQGHNTKSFSSTPSCLFSQNKPMVQTDEPNNYTILAMVAGIRAANTQISDTTATISVADP